MLPLTSARGGTAARGVSVSHGTAGRNGPESPGIPTFGSDCAGDWGRCWGKDGDEDSVAFSGVPAGVSGSPNFAGGAKSRNSCVTGPGARSGALGEISAVGASLCGVGFSMGRGNS